jgi:hypothetical protein
LAIVSHDPRDIKNEISVSSIAEAIIFCKGGIQNIRGDVVKPCKSVSYDFGIRKERAGFTKRNIVSGSNDISKPLFPGEIFQISKGSSPQVIRSSMVMDKPHDL